MDGSLTGALAQTKPDVILSALGSETKPYNGMSSDAACVRDALRSISAGAVAAGAPKPTPVPPDDVVGLRRALGSVRSKALEYTASSALSSASSNTRVFADAHLAVSVIKELPRGSPGPRASSRP